MKPALVVIAAVALVVIGLVLVLGVGGVTAPIAGSPVDEQGRPYYDVQCDGRLVLGFAGNTNFDEYTCIRVNECRQGSLFSWWSPDFLTFENEVRLIDNGQVADRAQVEFDWLTSGLAWSTRPFEVSSCTSSDKIQLQLVREDGRVLTEEVSLV